MLTLLVGGKKLARITNFPDQLIQCIWILNKSHFQKKMEKNFRGEMSGLKRGEEL